MLHARLRRSDGSFVAVTAAARHSLPCDCCAVSALLPQVVPTEYVDLKGSSTNSNQFSVTENFRESADAHAGGRSLPGVFFFYDLSPIKVGGCAVWAGCCGWH